MSMFGGVAVDTAPAVAPKSKFGGLPAETGSLSLPADEKPSAGSGLERNFTAGFEEGVTGLADMARYLPGVGPSLVGLDAVHDANPSIPHVPSGHDINTWLGSANPENVKANTTGERLARGAGQGATAILAPEAEGPTMARALTNGILGMFSGVIGKAAGEIAPDNLKPEAEILGSIAGPAGLYGMKGVIAPQTSGHIKTLLEHGVKLTPGQIASGWGILGKTAKTVEDAISGIPGIGDIVKSAQRRGLESFQLATGNRALEPIGQKLPPTIKAGREMVRYVDDKLSDAYNTVLPKLNIAMDQTFNTEVANIKHSLSTAPQEIRDQFDRIVDKWVNSRFHNGQMSGRDFKDSEAELSRLSRNYSQAKPGTTPDQHELSDHISDLRHELLDMVERTNPHQAPQIRAINNGYAVLTRIERAAGSTGAVDGLFTAPQLQGAVKALDRSARKRAFARGDAMLQDLSDAGRAVLPSTVPDTGTATRGLMTAMALGGGGELIHASPAQMAAMGVAAGAYTPWGVKASEYALTRRPYSAAAVNQAYGYGAASLPAAVGAGGVVPYLSKSDQ